MKIVIVDDENITLNWLTRMIGILDESYSIVASFSNGKKAFEYCIENPVDLLITDIQMPEMNGIDLLKELNFLNIRFYTIFLSAYDEFSYAKQAIQLGASDYLLKPEITKDILKKSLLKAKESIYLKNEKKINSTQYELQDFLLQAIEGKNTLSLKILEDKTNLNISKIQDKTFFLTLLYSHDSCSTDRLKGFSLDYIATTSILVIPVLLNIHTVLYFCIGDRRIVDIDLFIKDWNKALRTFIKSPFVITSSSRTTNIDLLRNQYNEALEMLEKQRFYNQCGVLSYKPESQEYKEMVKKKVISPYNKILSSLEETKADDLIENINRLFDSIEKLKVKCSLVEKLTYSIILELYKIFYDVSQSSFNALEKMEHISVEGINESFIVFKDNTIKQILDIKNEIDAKHISKKYSSAVKAMIAYGHEHYSKKITLEDVANYVHLNRTYISSLFKKETGKGYITWLIDYRLEKASEMLLNDDKNINIIAEDVGIMDFAYFCSRFKAKYNCTPLTYRKNAK